MSVAISPGSPGPRPRVGSTLAVQEKSCNPASPHEVAVGDRIRALAGETVAVDASIFGGVALMDEMTVRGTPWPVRRVAGHHVLAGSKLMNDIGDIGRTQFRKLTTL